MITNKKNSELFNDYEYYLTTMLKTDSKRANTIHSYLTDVNQFLEYIDVLELDCTEVKFRHANEWLDSLKGRTGGNISTASRNRKICSLNSFYGYLIEAQETSFNPFKMITMEKINKYGDNANQITRDTLTIEEIKKLKQHFNKEIRRVNMAKTKNSLNARKRMIAYRNKAIFNLLLNSGMRVNELCKITFKDVEINRQKGIMIINIPVLNDKGKRGRKIPVDISIYDMILDYMDALTFTPIDDYIFHSVTGKMMTADAVNEVLTNACKGCGIEKNITPHSLRHTFATFIVNSNKYSLLTIAKILGHNDANMLQNIYYHLQDDELTDINFKL